MFLYVPNGLLKSQLETVWVVIRGRERQLFRVLAMCQMLVGAPGTCLPAELTKQRRPWTPGLSGFTTLPSFSPTSLSFPIS